jgi:hypothetical protein
MTSGRAEYVRDVDPQEPWAESVSDAKALTFETFREHAVLELSNGRRVLVRGGPYGIDLERSTINDPYGREPDRLFVEVQGSWRQVTLLVFHVHPTPTGPSDDDLVVLKLLGQTESMLYELFGPRDGTVIRPKNVR